jgi:putative transposase
MTYYERHLPHWYPPGQDIFITWRLHGSLPAQFRPQGTITSSSQAFARYDRVLDQAQIGPIWLRDPRIARSIMIALQRALQRKMFALRAYVLMVNHVHVLLAPLFPVDQITRQIKGATAREANLILRRTGAKFWQDESFDHWIRNPEEGKRIRTYIEQNPVTAGLASHPKD